MASKKKGGGEAGTGRINVEFRIDDLMREIDVDSLRKVGAPAPNCSGCDACSAQIDERASAPVGRVQVQFRIDDLMREIDIEGIRPSGLENCAGCDACMA